MHLLAEAKLAGVEGDRGVDVIDDVADAHGGHRRSSSSVPSGPHQHPPPSHPDKKVYELTAPGPLRPNSE
jgi:hypothetical protein